MPPGETSRRPILILGASTRAAAHSAIRAGLAPICIDQFADVDLHACANVPAGSRHPGSFIAAAARVPDCPWIYTGGLENHPRVVGRIVATRRVWGNDAEVLAAARDPWNVARLLRQAKLPACRLSPPEAPPPARDGRWLIKSLRGAGGRGIRIWDQRAKSIDPDSYFQELHHGPSCSAIFISFAAVRSPAVRSPAFRQASRSSGPEPKTVLVGLTRQLVGIEPLHAPPFGWCGNIAPVQLPDAIVETIRKIGELLARELNLCGIFGCDFVIDREQPWLTEINPRYPASTELVEWALGIPLLHWHRRACEECEGAGELECALRAAKPQALAVAGKVIVYADRALVAPDLTRFVFRPGSWLREGGASRVLPYLADIPAPGTHIAAGQPIATLYARGASEEQCQAKLLRRAARFESNWCWPAEPKSS